MREISFEKPVSKEEVLQVECTYNLGSEREREIILEAAEMAKRIVQERPIVVAVDTDVAPRRRRRQLTAPARGGRRR
jgi:hypothetical protein